MVSGNEIDWLHNTQLIKAQIGDDDDDEIYI